MQITNVNRHTQITNAWRDTYLDLELQNYSMNAPLPYSYSITGILSVEIQLPPLSVHLSHKKSQTSFL